MVYLLTDDIVFPDPSVSEADGLLAVGGDLSPARLRAAYSKGIFPWYAEEEPICWYAPHERCVIYPNKLRVSRSMEKQFRKNTFEIRINTAFREVVQACAMPRADQQGTWINDDMAAAYQVLHELGDAHSIEAWQGESLVGGMYGIKVNDVFCGESMFSLVSNASKYVLIHLLRSGFCSLLDCQIPNPHLQSLGAEMIPQQAFLSILQSTD